MSAYVDAPRIYTRAQMKGWKRVVDPVHAKDARIFLQMRHAGRQTHPAHTGGVTPVAPSALRSLEHAAIRGEEGNVTEAEPVVPRALEAGEIGDVVEQFRRRKPASMASNFMAQTDISSNSFCSTARTIAPTRMAAQWKTVRAFCSKRSMPSSPCGALAVSLCACRRAALMARGPTATRMPRSARWRRG
jgi:hypothetical protein